MIKNNILGQFLIGVMAIFLLIGSVQMFGWGTGINKIEIDQEQLPSLPVVPKGNKNNKTVSEEDVKKEIGGINERPMFSLTREPFVELADEDGITEVEPEITINEIKAQLTGVVITPTESYAMIFDSLTNQRETYRVGMPLEGDQGGWTLNSIQSRKVVFVSDNDETSELELEVFSAGLSTGGNNKPKNASNSSEKPAISQVEKKKNADDIRKKIAERRAQMRADAAAKNKKR